MRRSILIDRVNLSDEGDPDMEVKRSIKVFLLLSESSLDLLPVKSDMAEVISRQDWTARISEERASRAETKFLLASLRSISVRIF